MWQQLDSGRVTHRFEWVVLVATLAVIPVMVIEVEASSSGSRKVAFVANWVIWMIFVAELIFILTVAPRKKAALRAHWLDALIIVVTAPLFVRFLASLRLIRLVRFLRLLRLTAIVSRAVQRERHVSSGATFRLVAVLTIAIVVLAGSVEALVDSGDFPSTWDGIWWAMVTVTTVGYGDIYPKSVDGRIIAMVVMLFGIGFLSVLTATVASYFVKSDRGNETEAILEALTRLEGDVAELKRHVVSSEASSL
jgi:voltage-gated potassium channel